MIVTFTSIILLLIFTILSGFHFYWLFGGTWGIENVIPTKGNNLNSIAIPKFATLIVSLVLAAFGFIYLINSGFINSPFPNWITTYGSWIIPIIFTLRAIGEFNYVGIFKKIKHTKFAKADTKIFTPLCAAIGVLGIVIQLLQ